MFTQLLQSTFIDSSWAILNKFHISAMSESISFPVLEEYILMYFMDTIIRFVYVAYWSIKLSNGNYHPCHSLEFQILSVSLFKREPPL